MTSQIEYALLKTSYHQVIIFNLWLLKEHTPLFHNGAVCGTYTLDGYGIMAFNQNLYEEIEMGFSLPEPHC